MDTVPSDARAPKFPVSVKGIVIIDGKIPLLKNERDDWELPGGKLEPGETPERTVKRELEEELSLSVTVGALADVHVYKVAGKTEVLIVAYECHAQSLDDLRISHEHSELRVFEVAVLNDIRLPEGYRKAIEAVLARRSTGVAAGRP